MRRLPKWFRQATTTSTSPRRPQRARLAVEALEGREMPSATTFWVTNANDSGPGSLRDAIAQANANPGADTIKFSIGTGVKTIAPLSALPRITDAVTIDGTSQPGYAGHPLIELTGAAKGNPGPGYAGFNGLVLVAGSSTIRGLAINRFETGVELDGDGDLLASSYIGTDLTGTVARPNAFGVFVSGNRARIGGYVELGAGNLISGNTGAGIYLSSSSNVVAGNYIGTDVTGTRTLGNGDGVRVDGNYQSLVTANEIGGAPVFSLAAPYGYFHSGNVISGNSLDGVFVAGKNVTNTRVQGNWVGTDASGTHALGNGAHGVWVLDSSSNLIGGMVPGAGNVIAANAGSGVLIASDAAAAAIHNQVEGN
jgi:hypothetical protein